jgi:hypothetical protein
MNKRIPGVVVITPGTTTLKETTLETISETLSASTITTSTVITTTSVATITATNVPTDGIFVNTTSEITVFVIITALVAALIAAILQFRRVRRQKDYTEKVNELKQVVIKPPTTLED